MNGLPAPDARAVETKTCLKGTLIQFAGRDCKMLPDSWKIQEPQVNNLDVLFLDKV